jgi:acyl carrier protein
MSMNRSDALAKVMEVVAETLDIEPDEVVESASYVEDLGADSLDLFELVVAFEEEFGVSISEDDVESIKTVKETVEYILSQAG